MPDTSFDAVRRVLSIDGSTPRRFRAIAARLFAGDVLRMPDEPTQRLASDWSFFDRHRDAFAEYVGVAGFRVLVDGDYKFAFLVHDEPAMRETLDKATSRVAVACRLLYHRAQQTVHLTAGVDVTMRELLERLDLTGGLGGRTPRVKTVDALRTLARFAMVTLPPRFMGYEDERVTITPVLARRLPLTAIQEYLDRTRPGRVKAEDESIDATDAVDASDLLDALDEADANEADGGTSAAIAGTISPDPAHAQSRTR